jgi:carbonyl reductase 1
MSKPLIVIVSGAVSPQVRPSISYQRTIAS